MNDVSTAAATPAARPFWIEGGPIGVLLIHGFMGLPGELRSLGDDLARRGYTVSGMLLARHGQHPAALYNVRWQEWYSSAQSALHELQHRCRQVIVIGYSLGGLLALRLAAEHQPAGVVTLAAALELAGGWPLRTLPVARYLMPWFYPMRRADFSDPGLRADLAEKMGEINWEDPAVLEQLRATIRIPTGAIYEVMRLGQRVRRDLPRVRQPLLIVQGRRDTTVVPRSAEQLYARAGSADKQLAWFERSGHLLPNDVERAAVWQTVGGWIEQHVAHHAEPSGVRLTPG